MTACLHTAAQLHGFDISNDPGTHVLAAHDWSSELRGLVQHRCELVTASVLVNGYWATSLAETAVRVACREREPAKVLAVLDPLCPRSGWPSLLWSRWQMNSGFEE